MAYFINIGLPTLWVTFQLWFVYFVLYMMRTSLSTADAGERMIRFGATTIGVVFWLYIVASAITNHTPLVSLFAMIFGTVLPMAYMKLNQPEPVVEEDQYEDEAPSK